MTDDNRILEVVTVQANAFKILTELNKELFADVNIEFHAKENYDTDSEDEDETDCEGEDTGSKAKSPASDDTDSESEYETDSECDSDEEVQTRRRPKNKGGMRIIAINQKRSVLIYLKLDADNFDEYICKEPKIVIGVNMLSLHRLIRTINNTDTLTLYLDRDDINRLGIKVENAERNYISNYKLDLMDIKEDPFDIPSTEFDSMITMPSDDFHKICRNMHSIADKIEIKSVGKQLIFSCQGDFATQEIILGETENGLSVEWGDGDNYGIVQGIYELKHLVAFTKCTSLCNTIEIHMKNDYPLVIKYAVASLGNIYLFLTTIKGDQD